MFISAQQTGTGQRGFSRPLLFLGLTIGIALCAFFKVSESKAAAASPTIKSGDSGYCLDDYKNSPAAENKVVLWGCNDSPAQSWSVNGDKIEHNAACLSVQADSKVENASVVATSCANSPGQIWLKDGNGLFNPNSSLCLTTAGPHQQLVMHTCEYPQPANQVWAVSSLNRRQAASSRTCSGTQGEKIACYAEKEWVTWQSPTANHMALLSQYTDGTTYEAWCADFVSYVYKEAGYPFTQAYDGWDENNANNIQDYGFTLHEASSGYVPKPGDVAYFNYNGGHVEIVVSGGKTPTFIYGNSATIDPTTGNGQMKANTITSDGPEGQLVYYLSPN